MANKNIIEVLQDMAYILGSINHRAGTNYDQRSKTEQEIQELKTKIAVLKDSIENEAR